MRKHQCLSCKKVFSDKELDWIHVLDYDENWAQCPTPGCGSRSFRYFKSRRKVPRPAKSYLKKCYVDDLMSMREIALLCGTTHDTVRNWLTQYKITIRTFSEMNDAWRARKKLREEGKIE